MMEFALEASVYGAASILLMCFAWIVTRLLKRSSAALRHFVWLSAFVALLAFPAVRLAIPHSRFVVGHREIAAPTPQAIETKVDSFVAPLANEAVVEDSTTTTININPPLQIPPKTPPVENHFDWPQGLTLAWACGAALCLFQIATAMIRLRRLRTRSANEQFASEPQWVDRIGVRLAWLLRINEENTPPVAMTWGAVKPTVLLPDTSVSWSEQRLEAVMLHELAHVRRRDCASQLLTASVCALYWFNPLVWLGARAMRAEAESAADDLVLKSGIKPSAYAGELLRLAAELGRKKQPFGVVGVSIMKHSKIESRVVAILDSSRRRRGAGQLEAIGILAVALAVCIPCASLKPAIETDSHANLLTLTQDLADSSDFVAGQNDLAMAIAADDQSQSTPSPKPAPKPQAKRTKLKVQKHVQSDSASSLAALQEANRQLTLQLRKQVAALKSLQKQHMLESNLVKVQVEQDRNFDSDIQRGLMIKARAMADGARQKQIVIDGVVLNADKLKSKIDVQTKVIQLKGPSRQEIISIIDAGKQDPTVSETVTVDPHVKIVKVSPDANVIINDQLKALATQDSQLKSLDLRLQNPTSVTLTETIQKDSDLARSLSVVDSKILSKVIRLQLQKDIDRKGMADVIRLKGNLSSLMAVQANKDAGYQLQQARINLQLALEALRRQSARLKSDKSQQARLQRTQQALEKVQRELEKSH